MRKYIRYHYGSSMVIGKQRGNIPRGCSSGTSIFTIHKPGTGIPIDTSVDWRASNNIMYSGGHKHNNIRPRSVSVLAHFF
mmetsp:Transcript_24884/g.53687  ORF Transcript_24884/g.53687 Transcript_24884/m.53687 type:complete len:80 (+) Transcript_24884:241-480(+)